MIGHDMFTNDEWAKQIAEAAAPLWEAQNEVMKTMPFSDTQEIAGPPMFDLKKNQGAHTCIERIIEERGKRYGAFTGNALVSQDIKAAIRMGDRFHCMTPDQIEALEQIAAKISRIVTGDADYVDNWEDIAGFATLVANRLKGIGDGSAGHSAAVRCDDQLHSVHKRNATSASR